MIFFILSSIVNYEFKISDVEISSFNNYDLLTLKDCFLFSFTGEPVLPVKVLNIYEPYNLKTKEIKIIREEWERIDGFYRILPGQRPYPLQKGNYNFVEPDSHIYNSSEPYPSSPVIFTGTGIKNGNGITGIIIFPIRFIPKNGEIYILKNIEFEMVKEKIPHEKIRFHIERRKDDCVKEIIITKNEFKSKFEPLKNWKTKKGIKTEIYDVDSIIENFEGSSKPVKIRNFIKWAYTNLGTDYFLLGGQCDYENNQEIIPRMDVYYTSSGVSGAPYDKDTIPCDMFYSNLDGDWNFDGDNVFGEIEDSVDLYADVYVGRAPCKDTNDVKVFVKKVLEYEKNPSIESIRNVMLPAEFLYAGYWGDTVNNIISEITPEDFNDIKLYQSIGNYNKSNVLNAIESGIGFAHYAAHGNAYGTAKINIYDIDSLKNGSKIGIHTGISCLTGAIDYVNDGDCFAEHIINNPNGGGVASIMNTRYGWGYIPGPGPSETIDTTFFHILFNDTIKNIGRLNSISKEYFVPIAEIEGRNGFYRWCMYELWLFGEPEMSLWTGSPETLYVSFKSVLNLDDTIFIVLVKDKYNSPVNNARVCIWKNEEIYDVKYTDEGYAVFNLGKRSSGFMNLTITKDNFLPFEDSVYIPERMKVIINLDSIHINEEQDIFIQISDSSGSPLKDIEFSIKGTGIYLKDTTDSNGFASFLNFSTIYGETLIVLGRDIENGRYIYEGSLPVYGGEDFQNVSIDKSSDIINVNGYLMRNIEGEIKTKVKPLGYNLMLKGCCLDTLVSSESESLNCKIIPLKNGTLFIKILKDGFNVFNDYAVVKEFFSDISGDLRDSKTGERINSVILFNGFDTFSLKTENGNFSKKNVHCGLYNIFINEFGYYELDTSIIVKYPESSFNLFLNPKPISSISGGVKEKNSGKNLHAEIKVFVSDSLYKDIFTDSLGNFSLHLPFYPYKFRIKSSGYKALDTLILVSSESLYVNILLEKANYNILIVKDDTSGKSADIMDDFLSDCGYSVSILTPESAVNTDWDLWDIVIVSCGGKRKPIDLKDLRKKILNYCNNNGKLLIEGGEVGYYYAWDDFGKDVLHIKDWLSNYGGAFILKDRENPLVNKPNILPDTIPFTSYGWTDQDVCIKDDLSKVIYGTYNSPESPSILVYDNTPPFNSGLLVYYAFNFEKIDMEIGRKLLENTIYYLLSKEGEGNSYLRVFSEPEGTDDNSVVFKVYWEGKLYKIDSTDKLGEKITPLFEGNYDIIFTKNGYTDTLVKNIHLFENETTFVKINLYPFVKIYSSDFESDSGYLNPSGDWEWGELVFGPDFTTSGVKCWGTSIDTNYSSNSDSRLETPDIILPYNKKIKMSFNMWFHSDSFYDGGNVKISRNNGGFNIIEPVNFSYNTEKISSWNRGIPKEKGWTGNFTKWRNVVFDLSPFSGDTIRIRWHFGSDYKTEYAGWYIDDVVIGYTEYDVNDDNKTIFNIPTISRGKIEFTIFVNHSDEFEFCIYDILGRLIYKTKGFLLPGTNRLSVEIKNTGIYFIDIKTKEARIKRKIICFR